MVRLNSMISGAGEVHLLVRPLLLAAETHEDGDEDGGRHDTGADGGHQGHLLDPGVRDSQATFLQNIYWNISGGQVFKLG